MAGWLTVTAKKIEISPFVSFLKGQGEKKGEMSDAVTNLGYLPLSEARLGWSDSACRGSEQLQVNHCHQLSRANTSDLQPGIDGTT